MFTFDVSPDGADTARVTATSRDIAMWERTTKGASLARLERELRMSDLEEVAFRACVRHGVWTGGDLSAFRAAVDIVPVDVEKEAAEKAARDAADGPDGESMDDEAGPTHPAP